MPDPGPAVGASDAARSTRAGLGLVCTFYFLVKGTVNVLFITSLTLFFKQAGVEGLPYVYTVMNIIYMTVSGVLVARLRGRSGDHLTALGWTFLALVTARACATGEDGAALPTAFLLSVMVFDLLFNQFFVDYLNTIYPLQEGKANLPVVTAFGSLSFIISGLALKVSLSVAPIHAATVASAALLLACLGLLVRIRRTYEPGGDDPAPWPIGAEGRDTGPPTAPAGEPPDAPTQALALQVVVLSFLTMLAKYWLDYQYSRAITEAYPSEKDLASFIAVFTSAADLLVVISQMTLAAPVLRRHRLVAVLMALPVTLTALSTVVVMEPSWLAILLTQFVFTTLAKTVHNPASSLLFAVIPAGRRLSAMGRAGMGSSAGCMLAGLALLAIQRQLTVRVAFAVLAALFGAMVVVTRLIGRSYARQLVAALEDPTTPDHLEAIDALLHIDQTERQPLLARLLTTGGVEARVRAVFQSAHLEPAGVEALLLPLVGREEDPRVLATAARVLSGAGGPRARRHVLDLAGQEGLDVRARSNIVEALGAAGDASEVLPVVLPLLAHPHHRLRANAAVAVVALSDAPADLERALWTLKAMLLDRTDPLMRAAALAALGRLADESFVSDLSAALSDPARTVVEAAIAALGRIPIPGALEALERFAARAAALDLAARAAEEARKVRTLTMEAVLSVLDSLTQAERSALAGSLARIRDDRTLAIALDALALADGGAGKAIASTLTHTDDPALLDLVDRALTRRDGGVALDGALMVRAIEGGLLREDRSRLAPLFRALSAEHRLGLYDALLVALMRRVFLELACVARLSGEGAGTDPATTARLERDLGLVRNLAAARAPTPGQLIRAAAKLPGADRFRASLSIEYIQSQLGRPLAETFVPLMTYYSRKGEYLRWSKVITGEDVAAWTPEAVRLCLGLTAPS